MRTIMVLNPKGGCGKSTIATNLASYFANQELKVCLADYDPQGSSLDWLAVRPEQEAQISGMDMHGEGGRLSRKFDVTIMDAPAGTYGKALKKMVRHAQTVIIPILPSPMDMRAGAHFVEDLVNDSRVVSGKTRIAVVANRVREHTLIYLALSQYLKRLKIPVVATLRDTQNYIRAADRGLGIFEMAPSLVAHDLDQWERLTKWLRSKRSLPTV